jgi:beta-mannanase
MKSKKLLLTGIVVLAAAGFAVYQFVFANKQQDKVAEAVSEPLLAVYDKSDTLKTGAFGPCKHLVVRWNNDESMEFAAALQKNMATNQPLLITLEIWPPLKSKFLKNADILTLIAAGNFDNKIKSLALQLKAASNTVMLRITPDLEVYVNRYPWQMKGSEIYIKAFRHFAEQLKKNAPAVKMVWAPAGTPGVEPYWPGARWVDLISVTLKGKSEEMTDYYPPEPSMSQLIFRKLHRMRFFDKPVLVIGSEKVSQKDFELPAFDAAVNYMQQYKEVEYMDVNAADREPAAGILRKDGALLTGVYDPAAAIAPTVPVAAEHLFVNIRVIENGNFKRRVDSVLSRNHDLIITMEPYKKKGFAKDPQLMDNILGGKYDSLIDRMYEVIAGINKKVYLRWLHEMEIPITRYPWQSQDPIKYIKAYRYFVNRIRKKKPSNIYFVWGPAGDRGSMEFWPGTDVVDYTSIAIYGLPDKNITDHNKQESFTAIFSRKYNRVWFSHKPIFITEFGVKGPESYKRQWLKDAAATIEANNAITGVSYFNDADAPKAWGEIEAPDWAISPEIYREFLGHLKTSLKL